MKQIATLLILFSALFLFTSCDSESTKKLLSSDNFSNGKAGEVLVVINTSKWLEAQKDTLYDFFEQPQRGLSQDEQMFDVLLFNDPDFDAFFQRHRAIVEFNVDDKYGATTLSISDDVWSQPQIYIEINGNNVDSCIALLYQNKSEILSVLYENDLKRIENFYNTMPQKEVKKAVKEKFNINLAIPTQYFVANTLPNFMWLRYETVRNDRFIMIYKVPMTVLNKENCIEARNTITKQYIPGAVEGAYPIIEQDIDGYPITRPIRVGRFDGYEMRGLWKCEGDHMGGPFYSFTFLDPSGEYAITIDGFVYAPEERKRDYLREVEAIVKSLK